MTEQELGREEDLNPLMSTLCGTCGKTLLDCAQESQGTIIDIAMMQNATKILPREYTDVLERIVEEWRRHALPECNQMAID
jgi:hypothetical protein